MSYTFFSCSSPVTMEKGPCYSLKFTQFFTMRFWYYWYSTGTKRVHCNIVYQEYVAERDHTHMNATQWETLTEFVKWLGREGHCVVDETPKGWFVTYIDKDPEVIARQKVWFYQTFETNLFFNLINFKLFYTSIQGKFIWNCKMNASFPVCQLV